MDGARFRQELETVYRDLTGAADDRGLMAWAARAARVNRTTVWKWVTDGPTDGAMRALEVLQLRALKMRMASLSKATRIVAEHAMNLGGRLHRLADELDPDIDVDQLDLIGKGIG